MKDILLRDVMNFQNTMMKSSSLFTEILFALIIEYLKIKLDNRFVHLYLTMFIIYYLS